MERLVPRIVRVDGSDKDEYMLLGEVSKFVKSPIADLYPLLPMRSIGDGEELKMAADGSECTTFHRNDQLVSVQDAFLLMMTHFKERFIEYCNIVSNEKVKENGEEVKTSFNVGVRFNPSKVFLRSTAKYNSDLNLKRKEKCGFFDVNTMTIHERMRFKRSKFKIPNYPKAPPMRSLHDCESMPLGVGHINDASIIRSLSTPSVVRVSEKEIALEMDRMNSEPPSARPLTVNDLRNMTASIQSRCAHCRLGVYAKDCYVKCFKCSFTGHSKCMEMSEDMYAIVKTYDWMCIDCKPCSVCSKVDGDDQMLFCDRCDRGYHTFCVGLSNLPDGPWVCYRYCRQADLSPAASVGGTAEATNFMSAYQRSQGEIRCEDCRSVMSKKELQKWKRRTLKDTVLCSMCNHLRRFGR